MNLPEPIATIPGLPARHLQTHKGQTGHVALFAGSPGLSGAAVLCGLGALRGGAGLVRLFCPATIQPPVAAAEPSLMVIGLPDDDPNAALVAAGDPWSHVLAVGPGCGQSPGFVAFVRGLWKQTRPARPLVLDADGLNALTLVISGDECEEWERARAARTGLTTVLTPHPGELARLQVAAGQPPLHDSSAEARCRAAYDLAAMLGTIIVLKGHRTVVASPDQLFINTTGNPGMATGGMGDVLTGLIAALLGQGLSGFDAACLGVYVHGLAADYCARQIGARGYLAREVAASIPAALEEATRPRIGFGGRGS